MVKDVLHEPYQLVLKEPMEVCPRGAHQVSFFELVYIVAGKGKQVINHTTVPYRAGDLFLLTPDDAHQFVFETTTQLFFIRFNSTYLRQDNNSKDVLEKLDTILHNANRAPGCVLQKKEDRQTVKAVMHALMAENAHETLYSRELMARYIQTILVLVARNILFSLPEKIDTKSATKALDILQYVQANIYHPEKLKGAAISRQFGISETYIGRYFQKQTNETLQQYVMHYKARLIEHRLTHSDMRITEIADEFGFTDKSHLNRFFKKSRGITPSGYRKKVLAGTKE